MQNSKGPKRVFTTGMGIISAIGDNVEETFQSLMQKKSGLGKIEYLETVHKDSFVAGEVKKTDEELASIAGIDPQLEYPRSTLMLHIAAQQAISDAGLTTDEVENDTCLVIATNVGGMNKTEKYYMSPEENVDFIETHSCGYSTDVLARNLYIKGYATTFNTACSSGATAIMHASRLLRNGKFKRAIVGGCDSLCKFSLNGFKSLMILDQEHCKPFDDNRVGINLGEGSAFVVLESEDSLKERDVNPIAEVIGYANTNDAFHATASSPNGEGAYLCMQRALEFANLNPEDIDYLNVHGTATENNDLSEGMGIKRVFNGNPPLFSSTKCYTGHTTGAAGVVESVFSVLAIQNNVAYPNLQFETPMKEFDFAPLTELKTGISVNHVMTNSFGFGGNNTTLIFSKV
ncbi:MAG: beta-ketoacyl-[acyl-carrier-protein] synthase family protein [Bacteroidales bacterium]|nr:beta-ketoacyl-[acyl-carrier-protein] synthase family protein [Bacteroidales bacterium]